MKGMGLGKKRQVATWKRWVPATFFVAQAALATTTAVTTSAWIPGKPAADVPPTEVAPVRVPTPPTIDTVEAEAVPGPNPQFLATVQIAVHEPTQQLLLRSQKRVREQFASIFDSWPEFRHKRLEVRTVGNELVLSFISDKDMRVPMQQAINTAVGQINGIASVRGRTMFYRTSLSPSVGGYLEVSLDDSHTKIRSISAQSVPLRDLLKEIRFQQGSLSYLIPGECAQKQVDWSFGETAGAQGKQIDSVMSELATLFSLKVEKKNDTYIFSGTCTNESQRQMAKAKQVPFEAFSGGLMVPVSDGATIPAGPRRFRRPQVLLTLPPLE